MTFTHVSRVAEMLFSDDPSSKYYDGISELQSVLTRICGQQASLNWNNNAVAVFDMPGVRILLSLSDSPYHGSVTRLVISVGPSPITAPQDRTTMVHASICVRIVNRLKERCNPIEVRWNDVDGVVSADDIDKLVLGDAQRQVEKAQASTSNSGPDMSGQRSLRGARAALHPYGPSADLPAAWMRVANTTLDLATSLVMLPTAACKFAVTWYRSFTN